MLQRRTILILVLSMIIFSFPRPVKADDSWSLLFKYKETTGKNSIDYEYSYRKTADGYLLKVAGNEVTQDVLADFNYQTLKASFNYAESGTRITIIRNNNQLVFTVINEKSNQTKTIPINESAWYASPFFFKGFVLSDKQSELFFVCFSKDWKVMKLKMIKGKPAPVHANGQVYDGIQVTVTFPDYRSAFWHSDYWFRLSDGLLLKTEELRGPPGSMKTITELVAEKTGENI